MLHPRNYEIVRFFSVELSTLTYYTLVITQLQLITSGSFAIFHGDMKMAEEVPVVRAIFAHLLYDYSLNSTGALLGGDLNNSNGGCPSPVREYLFICISSIRCISPA